MSELRYSEDHEWARKDGEDTVVVGITEFAQEQLGEVVFVELPEVGATVAQGDETGVVESVKAASEIYAPVSGSVIEVNEGLPDEPELVNSDPTGEGWFFKLKASDASELDALMDEDAYQQFCDQS